MLYKTLNQTNLKVSIVNLGTMTYGEQNTQEDAIDQLDYATSQGVNFIDTAELYAIPAIKKETYGLTEQFIGNWLTKSNKRQDIVLATKAMGPTVGVFKDTRPNPNPYSKATLINAVEKSLTRLKTDYIDLYQLHWPMRMTNFFGQLNYVHTPHEGLEAQMLDILQTLDELITSGKIRYIGLSNETAWGTMKFIQLAQQHNLPKPITIQNPYNLLNRTYELGLAEVGHREDIGLLAYSPLAFGVLSGKHLGGFAPNSRLAIYDGNKYFPRYNGQQSQKATKAYLELAQDHGLTLVQLAMAYVNTRPFLTSNIIGATTMTQLKELLATSTMTLSDEVIQGIEQIHNIYTYPAP